MKTQIFQDIRQTLANNAEEKTIASAQKFFKENINSYGVKIPVVHKISKEIYSSIKNYSKSEIFELCDELWVSDMWEETIIACDFSYFIHKQYEKNDLKIFHKWLKNNVSNWASCDGLCNHTIGTYLEMYPEKVEELKQWAKSNNSWERRGAAVSLIIPARKGLFLNDILDIANILLLDKEDLVQKGYGWMLKAASMSETFVKGNEQIKQEHLKSVFDFVIKNKSVMPRTALRYAIEKMPANLKAEAMKK